MRAKEWRKGVMIGVLILVALWLGSLIWGLSEKALIAVSEAHQTEKNYKNLEDRKGKLQGDLNELETPRGQDAAIREAFGVARSGEEVIVVVPRTEATTTPRLPWWKRIFRW